MQPRARLLDLVLNHAEDAGLFASSAKFNAQSPNTAMYSQFTTITRSSLSVIFSPRSVSLAISIYGRRRTVTSISRDRNEPLEKCARQLVVDLKMWILSQN